MGRHMLWWPGCICGQTRRLQHAVSCASCQTRQLQRAASRAQVVQHEKARAVLMGQWGFGAKGELTGTTCLFHGPPGAPLACWHDSVALGRSEAATAPLCILSCDPDTGGASGRQAPERRSPLRLSASRPASPSRCTQPSAPDAGAAAIAV